ncbi:DUF2156 domain-containing protein [Patescibacteria group bacterium]|nr:DUF2156 domain-containing protein [Patescibacteria group bacterium]MBU1867928.1 DUF2156 domain-containing protein [Patescibacteria group bacterium]
MLIGRFNKDLESNYSDFQFNCLFSLDDNNTLRVSDINGNLVVVFVDSVSGEEVVSLLGIKEINSSLEQLLGFVQKELKINYLTSVPELTVRNLNKSGDYDIRLDRDNCDYLYDVNEVVVMEGKKFANMRRKVNLCQRELEPELVRLTPESLETCWQFAARASSVEITSQGDEIILSRRRDLRGLAKTIHFWDQLELGVYGVKIKNVIVAYAIIEVIPGSTILLHHWAVDHALTGLSEFMFWAICSEFRGKQSFVNFEQDLGYAGLRKFKQHLQPCGLLNKYIVQAT